jgi:hypothetical protein
MVCIYRKKVVSTALRYAVLGNSGNSKISAAESSISENSDSDKNLRNPLIL